MAGLRARPEDTSPEMWRRMIEGWRAMSSYEKAELVNESSKDLTRLALAGIRHRHPGATDDELRLRLGALRLGPELMRAAFGWDPREQGY